MKDSASLRGEIVNKMWESSTIDPKRSRAFHKWLEQRIKQDRQELLNEITSEIVHKCDSFSDCMNVLTDFKIK